MKNKWKEFKLKMFGFTLIELLAVVIILAIVALIATPIILNVIKEAQDSADMSSAQLIANEGHNYYAGAMLDEIKKEDIELEKDIYSKLNITNKPEIGQLYVNKKNEVAMAIVINNKCYKKTYESEIEVVDVAECELGYMGPDSVNPEVSQKVINTSINENGWYKEDIYVEIEVKDNESGAKGYKRCMGQSECEPSEDIYEVDNKIYINIESATNYVCVIGVDRKGNESEKKCEVYKLDKTQPNVEGIEDKVVQKDEKVDLSDGVRYDDTLSGIEGEIIIEPSSIDTSETGTKQVKYKVIDKAGNIREVIRNIIVDAEAPTIEYNLVNESSINSNGWAKENFYVRATITDNSGSGIRSAKSCVSNSSSECSPIAEISGNTKEFYIEVEGSNRLCIEVTDNNNKTNKICSDTYKLDKTAPIAGTANIIGTLGSNGWYTSDVTINVVNGNDNLSGHLSTTSNITSITSNTIGQTVIITTTDLAGNTSNKEYIVKVDKNSPTLTAKSGNVEITEKDSNLVSNYFNVSYSISGGNISCSPANTNSLSAGTHTLSCTATGENGKSVTATKQITVKINEYADNSGANKPELLNNMIPVKYDGSNWVYADIREKWYDYNTKEWANAVVLNSGVSKNVGDTISESEIALWYVWIPRYKYQLFNASGAPIAEQEIQVVFESGTSTTGTVRCTDSISGSGNVSEVCTNAVNGNWYTHPAFTFGTEQLTGFWIGKFEVSGSTDKITIKPNVSSLRGYGYALYFKYISNMKNVYGLSGDSHMMKNMEWGAVTYLKQSKYGLGIELIRPNNNSSFISGCGPTGYKSYCQYPYDSQQAVINTTTGNIYGMYDMAGNTWEFVMAFMADSSGSLDFINSNIGTTIDKKYYDAYTYSDYSKMQFGKLGDATKEVIKTTSTNPAIEPNGWYEGRITLFNYDNFLIFRGGYASASSSSSMFDIGATNSTYNTVSTRAVITP